MKPGSEGTVQAKLTREKLTSWNREKLCSLDGAARSTEPRSGLFFWGEAGGRRADEDDGCEAAVAPVMNLSTIRNTLRPVDSSFIYDPNLM